MTENRTTHPFALLDVQEAVALGIGIALGDFELGTGLIPQPVFQRLYDDGLVRIGQDNMGESFPVVTDKGRERFAEILGGDVDDI